MKGGKFLESYFSIQTKLFNEFSKKSVLLMQKGKFYEIYGLPEDNEYFSYICNLLGILQSRTDKSLPLSKDNPFMAGFPIDSLNRHLKTLTEKDYKVQIVDESKSDSVISRDITRTVSNTTFIDDSNNNLKYICYILIIDNEMAIGLINLQIGEVVIYPDQKYDNDTLSEIISKYSIGETIIHSNTEKKIEINTIYTTIKTNPFLKVSYKEEVLQKIYKKTIGISIIESLGLERFEISTNLLTFLVVYALKYDSTLLRKLSLPIIINIDNTLHLPENAIKQLDIIDVIKEIDKTSTPMGSRLLYRKVLNPQISDITYNTLELSTDILRNIGDIDKLWIKLTSTKAGKNEIIKLFLALKKIKNLFENIKDISNATKNNLDKTINYISKRIILDNEQDDIFNLGYCKELDLLKEQRENKLSEIEDVRKQIHIYLILNKTRDKIYFTCTNEHKKEIKTKVTASKSNKGWKIQTAKSEELFNEYLEIINKFEKKEKKCLEKFCKDFTEIFSEFFQKVSKKVAQIDLDVCSHILINSYGYNIPTVQDNTNLTFEGLFHPISKNLVTGFVSQDLELGGGMLLYGVNFSGKSTLLRSVGIAVILAQAGLPCPVKKMIFSPFSRLYSKISLGDSYIKGQSTFTNEIYEMKKMVNDSDSNTLILADELCSGTEINSAVALVASSIMSISKKGAKFIFTTHYHDLAELEEVKSTNTEIWHLAVERSEEGGFKFIRKLVKGKCGDIYGIEIAIHMDMNNEFIKNASKIRNKLVNNFIIRDKVSRYNSDVYLTECRVCQKRDSLHTHHIKFQRNFSSDDKTKNYKGNLIVLCEECHQKVHKNEISIYGYVESTDGILIE
jgi:DNA mismatch repair protein MutS